MEWRRFVTYLWDDPRRLWERLGPATVLWVIDGLDFVRVPESSPAEPSDDRSRRQQPVVMFRYLEASITTVANGWTDILIAITLRGQKKQCRTSTVTTAVTTGEIVSGYLKKMPCTAAAFLFVVWTQCICKCKWTRMCNKILVMATSHSVY